MIRKNKFIRNYKIREIKDDKINHNLIEITGDIKEVIDVELIKKEFKDIEYEVETDKELDLMGNNSNNLDNETINDIDEEIVDEDLDIEEIDDNEEDELFNFEELADDDIVIDIEEELEENIGIPGFTEI